MTADEFWYGEPRLCEAYRSAHEIKQDIVYAQEWRQGQYTLLALKAALDSMLYGGKNRIEYPEEPLLSSASAREAQREARERKAMEKDRARMEALAAAWNAKFRARKAAEIKEEDPPSSD